MEATAEKSLVSQETHNKVDAFEAALVADPNRALIKPNQLVTHTFTPGLYIRTIRMPKGFECSSKIHRKEHPFVITEGEVDVWDEFEGVKRLKAGHLGITKAGTRRALKCHTDVVWTTYHVTDHTDLEKIEEEVIEPHSNPLLPDEIKQILKGDSKCLGTQ